MSADWLHLSGRRVKNPVTVIRDRVECLRSGGELLKEDYKGIITFFGEPSDRLLFLFHRK